jgi:predicted RNase H-like nuclease
MVIGVVILRKPAAEKLETFGRRHRRVGSMSIVCGVDGCKTGWLALTNDLDAGSISYCLFASARELINSRLSLQVISLDIPTTTPLVKYDSKKNGRSCPIKPG